MPNQIRFHYRVPDDLKNAFDYYDEISIDVSNRFRVAVSGCFKTILENPALYAIVYDDVRVVRVKKFPYSVHYKIINDAIKVMAVFHTSIDSKAWHERE